MTTLSDLDIKTRMDAGYLVRGGTPAQIGPSCYELRMGQIYYDLTEDDKRIDASANRSVLIKPGHRVVLITQEELVIPHDIIARVTSKGSLFSIGLSPVSTYADPGFSGNLGVVTQNLSDKYIEIPVGEPIAKVNFSTLSGAVQNPYKGQHGFQTQIWPIKHQLQKCYEEIKHDPRVKSEIEEAYRILPAATASILRQLQRRQRNINVSILFVLVVNMLTLAAVITKNIEPIVSVITNLISSAIVGVFMWVSSKKD